MTKIMAVDYKQELEAIEKICLALEPFSLDARIRILQYVMSRLGIPAAQWRAN